MTTKNTETSKATAVERNAEDRLVASHLAGATASGAAAKTRTMMRVWYADGTCSELVNPNRPKALIVLEAHTGKSQPEGVADLMWLVWHCLGRPGANGKPENGDDDAIYESWFLSTEELDTEEVERGKPTA